MNIQINKDFESYKEDFYNGLTLKESICVLCAGGIVLGTGFGLWKATDLPPDMCVFAGIPFAVPVVAAGMIHIQGLTPVEYLKEILFTKKTELLLFDAEEIPPEAPDHIFYLRRKGR